MKTEELTKTIAIYQSPYGGFITCEYSPHESEREYVRITEPITVTFVPRKADEVIAAACSAIDRQIVEAQQTVRKLEQKKAELLALPPPESV